MGTTRCTVSVALARMKPAEREWTLKEAAAGIVRCLQREKSRTSTTLYGPEYYFKLVMQHYHSGAGKNWEARIEDASDVIRLLVNYGNFFILRESRPKIRTDKNGKPIENRRPVEVPFDEFTTPIENKTTPETPAANEVTPESIFGTKERQKIERAALDTILAERPSGSAADERLFLEFIRILKADEALKDGGSFGLNAKYVAKELGVSPSQASTLWQHFKKLCRAANSPTLKTLIEIIDPRWLLTFSVEDQSERTDNDTSDVAPERTHDRTEGLQQ
jgi:hypothetical protein